MNIEFINAKNGNQTVKINSILLHSLYNPDRESENFVKTLEVTYNPEYIVITEPALSYCEKYLRNRFPRSKIIAIRYLNDFQKYGNFDYTIQVSAELEQNIQKVIPENKLFNTLFLKWEPSAKIFYESDVFVWSTIKKLLQTNKTLLVTRQYFEKKWLINSCNFLKYTKNFTEIKNKINKPIIICASGPSLKDSIKTIKKYQNSVFIICLSSAISALSRFQITPDLYFSTDGGYWANFHLRKINKDIPLALNPESYCNKKILQNQLIFPLIYNDGYSCKLRDFSNIKFYSSERNGTVSGTALRLAEAMTDKEIFFAGLDLCSNKGFQHFQPNELKLVNLTKYDKIHTEEKQEFASSLNNESLKIYEDWFKNASVKNKTYRIINSAYKKNEFKNIKDISIDEFLKLIKNENTDKTEIFNVYKRDYLNTKKECSDFYDFLQEENKNNNFNKNIFVLDIVSLERNEDNLVLKTKINNESKSLLEKIQMILE